MKTEHEISSSPADHQLPSGFIVTVPSDGTTSIAHKKSPFPWELLIAAGAFAGGWFMLSHRDFQFAIILFGLAALMVAGMWTGIQKLEYSISDGTFSFRRGPCRGRIAADDIVSLDADQLGTNAKSFAVVAIDRDSNAHHLFRYLDESEAKALLNWVARQIEEKK